MPNFDKIFRDRLPYNTICDRKKLKLPKKVKLVVWIVVNVEHWDANRAMPRSVLPPPMGNSLIPDLPNWAWHEYGMRQGYWRFIKCLNERNIKATLAINGLACTSYKEAVDAALESDWEFLGHGFDQRPTHLEGNQLKMISSTMEAIKKVTGKMPRGWESPGITETVETIDNLKSMGIEYVCNWICDDVPFSIKTKNGPIVSLPYTVDLNDVVLNTIEKKPSNELYNRGVDHFDRLYKESDIEPRFMAIAIHPYLTGVPHRIKYLEKLLDYILNKDGVEIWKGEEICDWYLKQAPI